MAALRTGKLDWLYDVSWEDAASLQRTSPELEYNEYIFQSVSLICWKVDDPELPFYDKRVRQALTLALDTQEMVDTYYGGRAEKLAWPVLPIAEYQHFYTPLEELPASVRELYEYHPDKAKQLLAEAGYADGFKAEVVCYAPYIDVLSIIKDYWSKVGVDLEIAVKEYAAYRSLGYKREFKDMYISFGSPSIPFGFVKLKAGLMNNHMGVDDPKINEAWETVNADEGYFDFAKKGQLYKPLIPYILEQAYVLALPGPYKYHFWQPWLENYHGEMQVGYITHYDFCKYVWLDQDLKYEMTGIR